MSAPFDRDDWIDEPLRRVLAERAAAPGEHPDPEELLEYHLRALPPEEEERVAEHLARCAGCARLVLDYDAFSAAGTPETPTSEEELERAWARFGAGCAGRRRSWWNAPAPAWALAASLLLAAGLFFWGKAGHERRADGERPSSRVAARYLEPVDRIQDRGGEPALQIEIDPYQEQVSLILGYAGKNEPSYRMELRAEDGGARQLLVDPRTPRDRRKGYFAVVIPAHLLAPGRYWIGISKGDESEGTAQLLAQYRFQVVRTRPVP